MLSFARVTMCLVGLSAVAAASPAVAISGHRKTVEVKDPAWGITAFTIEIPDNWSFEGALLRDPHCGSVPAVAYRIASPDGRAGVQVMPAFGAHWSDDPNAVRGYRQFHCKMMQPMSPADWLQYLAPAVRPNPTIGTIGPTADAAQLEQAMQQHNARLKASHQAGGQSGGGVRSLLSYTLHGEPIEENLRVVVTTFEIPTATGHSQWNTAVDVTGVRAPQGQLQDVMKQLGPMMQSAKFAPAWIQRQQRQMAEDNAHALATIKQQGDEILATLKRNHDAYMKQSRESFEHGQQADRDRQDAMHRSAVAWTLYAGDEQLVRNPQTGAVSRVTSTAGRNVHQDQVSGMMIETDNPSFDPAYYIRGQWTQLENVDPLTTR